MPKRPAKGPQLDTITRLGELAQHSFELNKQDAFVTSLGVQFQHFKAVPSTIGLKDRGDYRRSGALDTISSNGMIYHKSGCFTAAMVGNSNRQKRSDGGILDDSSARLILPRFYDKQDGVANGDRIYLAPGDRVYISDPQADVLVTNYHRMDYEASKDNKPMFPIAKIEFIEDSRGIRYDEGTDFCITEVGDIRWQPTGNNPGIDPETKTGRIYSVRYLYKAFWYIVSIPNEVRITNITNGGVRAPERMSYHAVVQREYIYHQTISGSQPNALTDQKTDRTVPQPIEKIDPNSLKIKVNMDDIVEE